MKVETTFVHTRQISNYTNDERNDYTATITIQHDDCLNARDVLVLLGSQLQECGWCGSSTVKNRDGS